MSQIDKSYLIKIFSVLIILTLLVILNNKQIAFFTGSVSCLKDNIFTITQGFNNYLRTNTSLLNGLIIISSLFIDLIMLSGLFCFIFVFHSWRMLFSLFTLYSVRGIIQILYQMPFNKDFMFLYPGFPSMFVCYLKTNDFFFSGHCAMPLIIGHEFFKEAERRRDWTRFILKAIGYFTYFSSSYEGLILITTRGHYSIDVYFGVIIALYINMIADKLIPEYIDQSRIGYMEKENYQKVN